MRHEDLVAVRSVMRLLLRPERVVILSGSSEECELVRSCWPDTSVTVVNESAWNLDGPIPYQCPGFDLAIACNTFMCARDPGIWLDNIAQVCRYVLIQDQAAVQRRHDRHLSPETGDVARYSVSSHDVIGKTDDGYEVFDFSLSGYRVIDCERYCIDDRANTLNDFRVIKFAVLLDLSEKVPINA